MSPSKDMIFDPSGDVLLVLSKKMPTSSPPAAEPDKVASDSDKEQLENEAGEATQPEVQQATEEVEVKVSSRHLALASPVFRTMFDGGFKERVQPGNDPHKVHLPEDDYDALLILLRVIHGLNKSVPRLIVKDLFVRVIVLLDKYKMYECALVYTDLWFDDLWPRHDETPPHLVDWIFICWALDKFSEFDKLVRLAVFECTFHFEDNGLPLPGSIASKRLFISPLELRLTSSSGQVESRRAFIVKSVIDSLKDFLDSYMSDKQHCSEYSMNYCDPHVLGVFIKQLRAIDLYPVPEAAVLDMSMKDLFSRLRCLKLTSYCTLKSSYSSCGGIKKELEEKLSVLEGEMFWFRTADRLVIV